MNNIELSVLVDDLVKLNKAIECEADAVYLYADSFNLNNDLGKENKEELAKAISLAHNKNTKVYIGINNLPHNDDFNKLEDYLNDINSLAFDGIYVSDPGILKIVKEYIPNIDVYLNYHANVTNYMTAKFWYNQGIKRISVTRELDIDEICGIRADTPLDLQIEAFVHGGVNISYSGRKLISNYVSDKTGQDIEKNIKYKLEEEKRPGEYFPVYENEHGTYLFNSKDLCMIDHVGDLIKAGVDVFTIDSRLKDENYVEIVTNAYKTSIELFKENPHDFKVDESIKSKLHELEKIELSTGFYIPKEDLINL